MLGVALAEALAALVLLVRAFERANNLGCCRVTHRFMTFAVRHAEDAAGSTAHVTLVRRLLTVAILDEVGVAGRKTATIHLLMIPLLLLLAGLMRLAGRSIGAGVEVSLLIGGHRRRRWPVVFRAQV